jgi:cytoskeletal protein CcmA (bactofilin family)
MKSNDAGTRREILPDSQMEPLEEKTTIGESISLIGDIEGNEDLVLEGSLKGIIELKKGDLTVSSQGKMEGEILAENVTIFGRVTGKIRALRKVEIKKEAKFNGEIKAKEISVADGTVIKAAFEIEREPDKQTVPSTKPTHHVATDLDDGPVY